VGKNKLARWNELGTFHNVIQYEKGAVIGKEHPVKGKWKSEIFRNQNPVILELGCGKGEYTTSLSQRLPGNNYIGVDIKGARMWRGAKTASEKGLQNTAFLRTRIEYINSFFTEDEVDEIWLTFPDPQLGKKNIFPVRQLEFIDISETFAQPVAFLIGYFIFKCVGNALSVRSGGGNK